MPDQAKLDASWIGKMLEEAVKTRAVGVLSDDGERLRQLREYFTNNGREFRRHRLFVFQRDGGLHEWDRGAKQWKHVVRQASGQLAAAVGGNAIREEGEALSYVGEQLGGGQQGVVFLYPYPEEDSEDPRALCRFVRRWGREPRLFLLNSLIVLFCRGAMPAGQHGWAKDVAVFAVPASTDEERLNIVQYLAKLYGLRLTSQEGQDLVSATKGLNTEQAAAALRAAYLKTGSLALQAVREAVRAFTKDSPGLGRVEPKQLHGRVRELQQVCETLCKQVKRNVIIVGPAGVGKTAIVEGLAWLIEQGRVPARLRDKVLVSVNLGEMTAGTGVRGAFEERLTRVIEEARRSDGKVILFIDEVHTLMQAEGGSGAIAAADILKPALASGAISCIGATTLEEYRKIEKDAALKRRFVPVMIDEPTPEEAVGILESIKGQHERWHGVLLPATTLKAAVEMSRRYIPEQHLPDKAIDLLERACVRASGRRMEGQPNPVVQPEDVAEIVAEQTGIPVARLTENETQKLMHMEAALEATVVGQSEAVVCVARAIRRARAGLRDPRKPVAVLLFVGPTGVGKTRLAQALAGVLFNDEARIIRLDMSEYGEPHTKSKLIGAPPGYVGFDQGNQLAEPVRRKPFSVVLLDEIEKAHPEVHNTFLQAFDEGRLTDGAGRTVDFRNTVIIMTSNLAAEDLASAASDEERRGIVEKTLREAFRPEFVNRIGDVVIFKPLGQEHIRQIVGIHLGMLNGLLAEQARRLELEPAVVDWVAREGFHPPDGARALERTFERLVVDPLSEAILSGRLASDATIVGRLTDGGIEFVAQQRT